MGERREAADESSWLTMTEEIGAMLLRGECSELLASGMWRDEARAQRERAEKAEAQNRELRALLEESLIMGERRIDNSEGAWSDLRSRLAEIEGWGVTTADSRPAPMPTSRVLTEEEVRGRLRDRYSRPADCDCEFCQFLDGRRLDPGSRVMTRIHEQYCPAVGVLWDGTHYREVGDGSDS